MSSSRLRSSAVSLIGRFMVPFSGAREQTDRRGLGHEGAKERQAPEGAADAPLASCCKILNTDRRCERTLPLHRRRMAIRYSFVASEDRPRRGVEGVSMR